MANIIVSRVVGVYRTSAFFVLWFCVPCNLLSDNTFNDATNNTDNDMTTASRELFTDTVCSAALKRALEEL